MKVRNPYSKEDGSPICGREKEFFDFAERLYLQMLEKLSPEKRQRQIAANERLNKRINS